MKILLPVLLAVAGALAGWIYFTRPAPSFAPPAKVAVSYPPAPTVLTRAPGAGEVRAVLDVEGMCCTGCTGKLHARLLEQPGVHLAAVDFESGTASAVVDAGLDPAALAAALTFDKYSARPHAVP